MSTIALDRTLEQRLEALVRANEIRSWRAELKRDLRARRRTAATVLRDLPNEVESMKIIDLLIASPNVGRVKANKMLSQMRISPSKPVGSLSERQRAELASILERRS